MSLLNTNKLYSACFRNIPHGWNELRLKYVANAVVEKPKKRNLLAPYVGLEHVGSGIGRLLQFDESFEDSSAILCRKGDVLFGKLRPYLAKCFLAEREFRCSSEFLVLRSSRYNPNYLRYLLLTKEFIELVNASTYGAKMPRASWDFIGNIIVPLPPMNVQEEIANYLDQQTAKLDELVEKKQRLIDLLQEKRQALITQAVTKGLDPNVPMKDSGIEWLGEVPAHWKIMKLTRIFRGIGSGTTPDSNEIAYYDGDIPWVITGDLNDGELHETSKHITKTALSNYSSLKLYPPGTLLIAMYGASIGKLAILQTSAATNQACCALYSPKDVDTKFVFYWLMANRKHIVSLALGGGQPNISQDIIRNLRICFPPIDEQNAILKHIDDKTKKIDKVVKKLEKQVELINEYRKALITAAVTGQIDVREKLAVSTESIPVGKE